MAETAINLTIGRIISGIGYIGLSIDEYNLKDERILELQREIQMMTPFIQNLQISPIQSGIHNRLQRLLILLQQIKSWINSIGQMSKLKHFFLAISHKKQMNKYYLEIKEIKMELGFEMRVGNFQSQTKLNQQMDDLLDSLKQNSSTEDYEKIKLLFDTQRELYDTKLQIHKDFIQEMDMKFNELIQDHEFEIEKLKCEIEQLKKRMDDVEKQLREKPFEQISQEMIEYQKIQLDIIKSNNYKRELDLMKIEKPTCDCKVESSINYPYTAIFCSNGCRGKKFDVYVENKEYYKKKLRELCESLSEEQVEHYEDFIQYIERGNFNEEHVVHLLEYEMEQKQCNEKRHYEQLKTLYHNIPRLDIVYGSFETFIKSQTTKHGRNYKAIERKFMFEYEQLVAQPDLETKLRTMWRCSPRIQRKYNENIYLFLKNLNWSELYLNYLPEYSETTHVHNIYYEKFLISLYQKTPELQQRYITIDKFLIQGENNNKTYKKIYEENEHYLVKDIWYEKCLFLWENVPRLQYNWNFIFIGFLTYHNLDFQYLYKTFYPEYKQLEINPKLREQIDNLWETREDIRIEYKNDYHRWLWADFNWQTKVNRYLENTLKNQSIVKDTPVNEKLTKEIELSQAREHYQQVYNVYRQHLVACVGESNSHGSTSKYANESWYEEHCRLWNIQSQAQSKVYNLEQELNN